MSLDHHNTCPEIDEAIKDFKGCAESVLIDMLDECCPLWNGSDRDDFVKDRVNELYQDSENIFENVRKSNSEMRKAADYQIDKLEEKIDQHENTIQELESEIESKDSEISDIENELQKLEDNR